MTKLCSTPAGAVLVAIDMSKNRQEVLIERPEGRRRRRMTLMATKEDYDGFAEQLAVIGRPIVVGFEATGNYHRPLAHLAAAGFVDTEIRCFWNRRMEMQRRKFSREFKLEAVKLVRERGVSVSQAARDLDLHENVLRKWVREQTADPGSAHRTGSNSIGADLSQAAYLDAVPSYGLPLGNSLIKAISVNRLTY